MFFVAVRLPQQQQLYFRIPSHQQTLMILQSVWGQLNFFFNVVLHVEANGAGFFFLLTSSLTAIYEKPSVHILKEIITSGDDTAHKNEQKATRIQGLDRIKF